MTDPISAGIRLLDMLNEMINGTDEMTFPGSYDALELSDFNDVYTDPYHNYFVTSGEDHVILVLHPALEDTDASDLHKYLWFGVQTDPVEVITPRKAYELIRSKRRRERFQAAKPLSRRRLPHQAPPSSRQIDLPSSRRAL